MASDRKFLVPVLRTLYELDEFFAVGGGGYGDGDGDKLSARVFNLSLDALAVVDAGDIPAVIRTLLKSALNIGHHNTTRSSADLMRVVEAVRACGASLSVGEQVSE